MQLRRRNRAGVATGDVLVILSLLALVFAVVYPRVRRAAFERRVQDTIAAVDILRIAAEANLTEAGAWPTDAPPEMVPAELAERLPADFSLTSEFYALDWDLWHTVHEPEVVPEIDTPDVTPIRGRTDANIQVPEISPTTSATVGTLAAITVRTGDELLLASLIDRFGPRRSFVGVGAWTLILLPPAAQ